MRKDSTIADILDPPFCLQAFPCRLLYQNEKNLPEVIAFPKIRTGDGVIG
jgi:hypothetical protein